MGQFDASEVSLHAAQGGAETAAVDAFAANARDALAGFGRQDPVTGRLAYPAIEHGADGPGIVHYEGDPLFYSVALDGDGGPAVDDSGNPLRQYFRYDRDGLRQPLSGAGKDEIRLAASVCALQAQPAPTASPAALYGKQYEGVQTLQADASIMRDAAIPDSIAAALQRGANLDGRVLATFATVVSTDVYAQLGKRTGGELGIA